MTRPPPSDLPPLGSALTSLDDARAMPSADTSHPLGRGRLTGILLVLFLVNVINYMDRSLLSVLAEPIKREFSLSDTQLGLLAGMAFALIYGLLALPIARIADRGLYRPVIMVCLAVWSTLTTLGGLSQSFLQLALMRFGVAAGEAGLNPAAHALISRLWPADRRGAVIALFSLGVPIGAAGGAILAGTIAQSYGWRAAFLLIGPLGLLMIPLLFVLPRFKASPKTAGGAFLSDALGLLRTPAYLKVWIACALASMFAFGAQAFLGPFYIRIHGLSVAQAGVALGGVAILGNALGGFSGGVIFDAVKRRWPGRQLYPAAAGLALSAGAATAAWLAADLTLSLIALAAALFLYGLSVVPAMTIAQDLAPPHKRAGASALMGISTGLVGATGGPLLAGFLSDSFAVWAGSSSLPYALSGLALALAGGAISYFLAGRDLQRRTGIGTTPR